MSKEITVNDKIKSKNLAKLPNVGSENPYDFSENKSDSNTCQILISVESGNIIKKKLENIIDNYRNSFIQKINLVTEKYSNPNSFKNNVSNSQNNNPIKTAFDNINIIQQELTKSVSDFNDSVRKNPIPLEKENISCRVFIQNKNNRILPIKDSYIKSINPSTGKISISFTGIQTTLEINMSQLCIGTLATPPPTPRKKKEEEADDQRQENEDEQTGGKKRHTKTKKRVGKRLLALEEDDELSYCD